MVKSTESRKFARTTNHLSRIQGIASHDDIPTELLDDHRALEPPDPIPNSVVKRRIADGSVVLHHVRVGHRQAPIRNPRSPSAVWGFFFAARKTELREQRSLLQAWGSQQQKRRSGRMREFCWGLSCLTRRPNLPCHPCRSSSWWPAMSAIC